MAKKKATVLLDYPLTLAELLPAGSYECWRVVSLTHPNAGPWVSDTSQPFVTRDGAVKGAAAIRRQIDDSRGGAMASPWRQVNIASSENITVDGEPGVGDIVWENTWGETVSVKRSMLVIGS